MALADLYSHRRSPKVLSFHRSEAGGQEYDSRRMRCLRRPSSQVTTCAQRLQSIAQQLAAVDSRAMSVAPRWVEAINKALSHPDNKGKVIYQVATVDARNVPHVRSQVHRAFMHPEGRPNLPLLVTSTDARSPKVAQVRANQRVELAWWMEGSQDQFRLSGFVRIFPSASAPGDSSPTPIPAGAVAFKTLEEQGFDWDAKRVEVYNSMSPGMRASWCSPHPPGSALASTAEQKSWPSKVPSEPESEEDRKNAETAQSNFALVLFEPIEVDWAALGVLPNCRTIFTRDGDKWNEQTVVP